MKSRLLVVDDEEGIRLLYKEEFEEAGFDVTLANSGEEALKILKKQEFDLLILDIKMSGIDGVELLRIVKEEKTDLPVILATAYPHYKHEFGTWACDAYVVKSSDLGDLKDAVKGVLEKKS